VIWLVVAYFAVGVIAFCECMSLADGPGDVAEGALLAALWPLVILAAVAGVAIDAVRAR
jgi:hypothetical protein